VRKNEKFNLENGRSSWMRKSGAEKIGQSHMAQKWSVVLDAQERRTQDSLAFIYFTREKHPGEDEGKLSRVLRELGEHTPEGCNCICVFFGQKREKIHLHGSGTSTRSTQVHWRSAKDGNAPAFDWIFGGFGLIFRPFYLFFVTK